MLIQDIRYAVRKMVRSPGFSLVVSGSLALGIGANAAMFGLADAVLFRPLPVTRPAEVVNLRSRDQNRRVPSLASVSFRDYVDLRDRSRTFEQMVAFETISASLASRPDSAPHLTLAMLVSGNFFTGLGVEPALGRGFRSDEDLAPGRNPVAVLSHAAWMNEWGGDSGVLGRPIRLNGVSLTIVGVAPERFWGLDRYDRPTVFVPLSMAPAVLGAEGARLLERRDVRLLNVKGRLRDGTSVAAAQGEMNTIAAELERTYPQSNRAERIAVRSELQSRMESTPSDSALAMLGLTLSFLVLVIACANVANLLLGRSAARASEISLRLAIGAGRTQLVRQLITESAVLALLGGVLSIALAAVGVRFLSSLPVPSDLPIVMDVRLDHRVLLYSLAAAIVSVLVFGLVPALKAARTDLASALKMRDSGVSGPGASRTSRVLVVAQVALSLMLLMAAGSLMQGLNKAMRAEAGFRTGGILMATFDPGMLRYDADRTRVFYRQLVDALRAIPAVRSVALSSNVPLGMRSDRVSFVPEGYTLQQGGRSLSVPGSVVDPAYFDTLDVRIVTGRKFTEDDRATSAPVIIVNEEMARKYWPGQEVLGRRLRLDGIDGPWAEVVGVSKRHLYGSLGEPPRELAYRPFAQADLRPMTALLEFSGDPATLATAVRGAVRTLDADMPVLDMRTMEDLFAMRAVAEASMKKVALGALALLGLALALLGLYGVVAHSVTLRTREMGVRLAIGATGGQVLRMVLRQGLGLTLVGVAIGVAAGVAASSVLGSLVFQATTTDPVSTVLIPAALLSAAALATLVPARRAAHVDPVNALRSE